MLSIVKYFKCYKKKQTFNKKKPPQNHQNCLSPPCLHLSQSNKTRERSCERKIPPLPQEKPKPKIPAILPGTDARNYSKIFLFPTLLLSKIPTIISEGPGLLVHYKSIYQTFFETSDLPSINCIFFHSIMGNLWSFLSPRFRQVIV